MSEFNSSTPDFSTEVQNIGVKDRFNYAKEKHEKYQQEKLNQIKQNPRESILRSLNVASEDDENTKRHFTRGENSADSLWKHTLDDLKDRQDERFKDERTTRQTFVNYISNYSLASTRITEWEEVSVQIGATSSELAHAWKIVKPLVEEGHIEDWSYLLKEREEEMVEELKKDKKNKVIINYSSYNKIPEPFTLGSTRIFPASHFGEEIESYLDSLIGEREKFISLDAGVQSTKGSKPPIRIINLITRSPYDKKIYVSFLISAHEGYEYCDASYGEVSIAVFKHETRERLFFKRFYLVWSIESLIEEIEEGNSEDIPDLMTLEEIEEQNESQASIENKSPFSSPQASRQSIRLSPSGALSLYTTPPANKRGSMRLSTSRMSSPLSPLIDLREQNLTLEDSIKIDLENRKTPVDHDEEDADSENLHGTEESDSEDEKDDEDMLKVLRMSIIPVSKTELQKHLKELEDNDENNEEEEPDFGYEYYPRPVSTCKVFYKRIKGVDIKGFIYKYHDTMKGLVPSSKKFFVLRDNYLSYHKFTTTVNSDGKKQITVDLTGNLRKGKGIVITKDSEIVRLYGRGVKISTPEPKRSIYLNIRRDSPKERLWIAAISQTIEIQKQAEIMNQRFKVTK